MFLTPREQALLRQLLPQCRFWGGTPDAERAVAYWLPEYEDEDDYLSLIHIFGRTFRVLIDGRDGDLLTARTDGGRLVRLSGGDGLIGQFRDVRITGSTTWSLTGELAGRNRQKEKKYG